MPMLPEEFGCVFRCAAVVPFEYLQKNRPVGIILARFAASSQAMNPFTAANQGYNNDQPKQKGRLLCLRKSTC
jgi:hypothetical protein